MADTPDAARQVAQQDHRDNTSTNTSNWGASERSAYQVQMDYMKRQEDLNQKK
jgi:hypothetical protein